MDVNDQEPVEEGLTAGDPHRRPRRPPGRARRARLGGDQRRPGRPAPAGAPRRRRPTGTCAEPSSPASSTSTATVVGVGRSPRATPPRRPRSSRPTAPTARPRSSPASSPTPRSASSPWSARWPRWSAPASWPASTSKGRGSARRTAAPTTRPCCARPTSPRWRATAGCRRRHRAHGDPRARARPRARRRRPAPRRGVVAALGHTDATPTPHARRSRPASRSARTCSTRCAPVHHREPGPVLALTGATRRVVVEAISDGVHLHPEVLRWVAASAPGRFALVTDAMGAAGSGDGDYVLGPAAVEVRDGVARLVSNGAIAGSTLTMDRAVRYAVPSPGFPSRPPSRPRPRPRRASWD